MFRNLHIRSKLFAVLAVPVLGMLLVTGIRASDGARDRSLAQGERRAAAAAVSLSALVHELQRERALAAVHAGAGQPTDQRDVRAQRRQVERAAGAARPALARLDARRPALRQALDRAAAALDQLGKTRAPAGRPVAAPALLDAYRPPIAALVSLPDAIATDSRHRALSRELATLAALSRAKELASAEHALVGGVLAGGGSYAPGDYRRLVALAGARQQELARFQASATQPQRDLLAGLLDGEQPRRAERLEATALAAEGAPLVEIDPVAWGEAMRARSDAYRQAELRLAADVDAAGGAAVAAAERDLRDTAAVAAALLALTFLISGALARSMLVPLLALRRAALEIAEERLPAVVERLRHAQLPAGRVGAVPTDLEHGAAAPVEVRSRDEIGQLARAFNAMQRVAVGVATEQAALRRSVSDMFVNLARRDQRLIDRQFGVLDELERDETNAARLDALFRLDHLATRLRRNAENLIVLSGSDAGRRWSQPVDLDRVVRAAVAEVEDYARVDVLPIEGVRLLGRAGIDVAHLLAELIENATAFSPPETRVVVAGEPVVGAYVLEIEDRGLGMTDEELAEVNERLADPPDLDLALAQRLGFYVVGRLAARYGLRVHLRHSHYGGVTALVMLPQEILASAPAAAAPPAGRGPSQPLPLPLPAAGAGAAFGPDDPSTTHLPLRRQGSPAGPRRGARGSGDLPRRVPQAGLAPGLAGGGPLQPGNPPPRLPARDRPPATPRRAGAPGSGARVRRPAGDHAPAPDRPAPAGPGRDSPASASADDRPPGGPAGRSRANPPAPGGTGRAGGPRGRPAGAGGGAGRPAPPPEGPGPSPERVRDTLSSLQSGLRRGRDHAERNGTPPGRDRG